MTDTLPVIGAYLALILFLVVAGLAGGWLSYKLRFAPLLRSIEKHLRDMVTHQ